MTGNNQKEMDKLNKGGQGGLGLDLLRYPITLGDADDGQNNYILFNINVQKSGLLKGGSDVGASTPASNAAASQYGDFHGFVDGNSTLVSSREGSGISTNVGGTEKLLQSQGSRKERSKIFNEGTRRIRTSVAIYMPGQLTVEHKPEWAAMDTGAAGLFAKQGGQLVNNENLIEGIKAASKSAGVGAVSAGTFGGTAALDSLTGSNFSGTLQAYMRGVVNPHVEVAFKAMANRTFSFEFTFTPVSGDEARQIREIIKQMRFHAAADYSDLTPNKQFLTYPSEFDISFWRIPDDSNVAVENDKIPKLQTCACTDVNVVYSDNENWVTFHDGMPAQIKMTLSFIEMTIITKDEIQAGF